MRGFTAQYSEACDLTLFVGQGQLTAAHFISAMEANYGLHPSSLAVWDVSQADLSGLDTATLIEISEAAKRSAAKRPNPRNLVVVGHEQEALLVKLYQKIAEMRGSPIVYELHYSLIEAYRSLGIADPFAEHKSSA